MSDQLPVRQQKEQWEAFSRRWAMFGPPLRPCAEDAGIVSEAIETWRRTEQPDSVQALILGVTPELYSLEWPSGSVVKAIDHSEGMIGGVWPGPPEDAILGDWMDLPFSGGAFNVALCDGGPILIDYPDDHRALVRNLHRVLEPGGLFVVRLFAPGPGHDTVESIQNDLLAGKFSDVHSLKLRLWTTLQDSVELGIAVSEVWDAVHAVAPDLSELAGTLGWDLATTRLLDFYKDGTTRYNFPSVEEVKTLFCEDPGGFTLVDVRTPGYPLGERCPTMVFLRM